METRNKFATSQAAFQTGLRLYRALQRKQRKNAALGRPKDSPLMPIYTFRNRPNRFSDVYYCPSTDLFHVAKHKDGRKEFEAIPWDDGLLLLDDSHKPVHISWKEWDENRDHNVVANYLEALEGGDA
jgi:hypothetical protein